MKNIYKKLKDIVNENIGFYSSIQEIEDAGKIYEIESFSYFMVPWSGFKNKTKKEMRGIAFITEKGTNKTELFTIGFHKFFNYGEGHGKKGTLELFNSKKVEAIVDKLDGSLIMFGKLPSGKIIAKSKTSINSTVSFAANNFINDESNKDYKLLINDLLNQKMFPIFEYIGPDNRIVIGYEKSELILLGVRNHKGKYLKYEEIEKLVGNKKIKLATKKQITVEEVFLKKANDSGYEGFILEFENGERLKIKLDSYINLHTTKDNINNRKKLILLALDEDLDDLRSLFVNDVNALEIINKTEEEVFSLMNTIKTEVEKLYEENKELCKKDYAIKFKKHNYFSLLMQIYNKGIIDYKGYVFKKLTN